MTKRYDCFTQLPDAKIKIDGLRTLKNYLKGAITSWNGFQVLKFTTTGNEVFVHILNPKQTKPQKHFYGYIEDVTLNAQQGYYELETKDE